MWVTHDACDLLGRKKTGVDKKKEQLDTQNHDMESRPRLRHPGANTEHKRTGLTMRTKKLAAQDEVQGVESRENSNILGAAKSPEQREKNREGKLCG